MLNHTQSCPVCSGNTEFLKEVNLDLNLVIQYHYCQNCGLIHSFEHAFFDSVLYANNYFEDIDSGWKERDEELFSIFHRHFREEKPLKVLDIGCGKNYFVSLLTQARYDAHGVDAYSEPVFAQDRFYRDFSSLPYSSFDVIVLIEVIEHFISPIEEFERVLKYLAPSGTIFFTTVIRRDRTQKSTDWYINPRYGHVTIWSMKALSHIFTKSNFKSATIYRSGKIQIWSRVPGSLFKQWFIQNKISILRSALGRIRYQFKERFL